MAGFAVAAGGLLGLGLGGLALAGYSGPLAVFAFVAYSGFAIFAGYCLFRGFATGRMFAVWSLTLFGDATLKQNPVWFWAYAAMNLVIVLIGLLNALAAAVS